MAQLLRRTIDTSHTIATNVQLATSMWQRMRGLLGTNKIDQGQTLWIQSCNSIHTLFMRYPIDIIFVNKDLKVCALEKELPPWRMVFPVWKARSVFEMKAGSIQEAGLKIGDQLYVDP